jgi:hypothetical protein
MFEEETVRAMWTKAHGLLILALQPHPSFGKLSKFFTFDQFLLHLGISSSLSTELQECLIRII